jgi:hypothetical protein
MSDYRTLNRTILAKNESTPGTDAAPVVADDAVKVEDPNPTPGLTSEETNEVTGSLDAGAAIASGAPGAWAANVLVKGSGAGGTAPEYGALLQSCGLAETLLAADITGTASAGAAGTITLASATNVEIGMVITTTGGTGSGQTRVITGLAALVASVYPNWTVTPDATTTYAIKACALYVPASGGFPHSTIYDYQHSSTGAVDSRLRAYTGWLGNAQLTLPTRQVGRLAFNGQAKFVTPTDETHPGAATYDNQRPVPFVSADFSLGGAAIKNPTFTLDLGNQLSVPPDPADAFGNDVGQIVRRRITGRINPPMALLSVRDVVAAFLAATSAKLWVRFGTPGNGFSLYLPELRYTGQENEDLEGLAFEGIPFHAQGEDTGIYMAIY